MRSHKPELVDFSWLCRFISPVFLRLSDSFINLLLYFIRLQSCRIGFIGHYPLSVGQQCLKLFIIQPRWLLITCKMSIKLKHHCSHSIWPSFIYCYILSTNLFLFNFMCTTLRNHCFMNNFIKRFKNKLYYYILEESCHKNLNFHQLWISSI